MIANQFGIMVGWVFLNIDVFKAQGTKCSLYIYF